MPQKAAGTFLWICLLCCVAALALRVGTLYLGHNYNVAAEANGLYGVLELADGKPLYAPKEARPYSVYLYPPVHPYISAGILKVFGVEGDRGRVLFARLISLLSVAGFIFLAWRYRPRDLNVGWLLFFLTLVLSSSKLADYASSTRNDCFSILLEIGAMVAFLSYLREKRSAALALFTLLSILAIWTRQNALSVFFAGALVLLLERQVKPLAWVMGVWLVANAMIFFALYQGTQGEIWSHLILSNVRKFRPLNREFFNASLYSFFAAVVVFAPACIIGVRAWLRGTLDVEKRFYLACFGTSFLLSSAVFLRAGGDVNYFFLCFLLGCYFAAPTIARWSQTAWGKLAIGAQLAGIAAIFVLKSQSAVAYADLGYEKMAERIRHELPPYGIVLGNYSQNMGIHLRGWAYHGPDVTNAGWVAVNGHEKLRWIMKDLDEAIAKGQVSSIVYAHPDCKAHRQAGLWFDAFPVMEVWADWVCVYRKGDVPYYALRVDVPVHHQHEAKAE